MLEVPDSEDFTNEAGMNQFPWFVSRMMTDTWYFGLLVPGNMLLVIERINSIREHGGILWLDVEMAPEISLDNLPEGLTPMFSPTKRTEASVRAAAIIAAVELADT